MDIRPVKSPMCLCITPRQQSQNDKSMAIPTPSPKVRARLRDGPKMTDQVQNADFRRKPRIFADSPPPILLETQTSGGRRKPQKTADVRRKLKILAENRKKPQIGVCHLRSITLSAALQEFSFGVKPYLWSREEFSRSKFSGRVFPNKFRDSHSLLELSFFLGKHHDLQPPPPFQNTASAVVYT